MKKTQIKFATMAVAAAVGLNSTYFLAASAKPGDPAVEITGRKSYTYGEEFEGLTVSKKNLHGVKIEYSLTDNSDAVFVLDGDQIDVAEDLNAGEYKVEATGSWCLDTNKTVAQCTGKHDTILKLTSKVFTVTVEKADFDFSVSLEGWTYGEEANTPVLEGVPEDYAGTITYSYENACTGLCVVLGSEDVPTQAGEYVVRAIASGDDNYNEAEETADFEITKADLSGEAELEGWTEGEEANEPTVAPEVPADYEGEVEYEYFANPNDGIVTEQPTLAGDYFIRANLGGDNNYNEFTTRWSSFTIAKKAAAKEEGGIKAPDTGVISTSTAEAADMAAIIATVAGLTFVLGLGAIATKRR